MVENGNPAQINLTTSVFLVNPEKLKQHIRTAIVLIQKLEAMDEQNWKDIILTTGNLGHIQIPTIIPSIGITLLVFLIHSRLSIIPMAHLSLRTLKEGSI